MSIVVPNQVKKKFAGFTDLYKNLPTKPEKKEEKLKLPFTGFSDFYKKLKEHEINDDDDDYDSQYDPFVPGREKEKVMEHVEEPPQLEDKHFKPSPYFAWCKDRTEEAFQRCAEPEVPKAPDEDEGASQKVESFKSNTLLLQIKQASRKKYENRRKYYDQNTHDSLSHVSGANPWFHKLLDKWRIGIDGGNKNEGQIDPPQICDGLLDIFHKLNAREKLQLGNVSRNVNNYPTEMQLKFLNRRVKKFLQQTKSKNFNEAASQVSSLRTEENYGDLDFNAGFTSERKELTDYFSNVVKPNNEINFKPEDFRTWYTKMSFNYDLKYRYMPKFNISPEPEDFNSWLIKQGEEITKNCNEFSKAFSDEKPSREESSMTHYEKRREIFDRESASISNLSNRGNPAVSNISSCRSRLA